MVETPLVTPDAASAAAILRALDAAGIPITVALWLKKTDEDAWELVLSTPLYDKLGPSEAYLRLIKALSNEGPVVLRLPWRIEGNSNPFIRGLRKMFGKTASVEGMHLGGHMVGGQWIHDAYAYRIK